MRKADVIDIRTLAGTLRVSQRVLDNLRHGRFLLSDNQVEIVEIVEIGTAAY